MAPTKFLFVEALKGRAVLMHIHGGMMQLVSLCLRFTFQAFVVALVLVFTASCAKGPTTNSDVINPINQDLPGEIQTSNSHRAAVWSAIADSDKWTEVALAEIRAHLSELESAKDIAEFCPGYAAANEQSREICWLRLVGAVVKFESGFNPNDKFLEANGNWSIGLLALSAHECPNAPTNEALRNPLKNLTCGIDMMASLIERDGFIAGPARARGAASYWSTLRPPYFSQRHHVGKKYGVMILTRRYLEY
jgi:hypothetical protein